MYNGARMKLTIFIIVVGTIAAINNLIGIIVNGPAALQKLTPVVAPIGEKLASLGSSALELRSFALERASDSFVRAALVLTLILVLMMLYVLRPSSDIPMVARLNRELTNLNQTTVLESRNSDQVVVLENGLRVPKSYVKPVDNFGPISESPLR